MTHDSDASLLPDYKLPKWGIPGKSGYYFEVLKDGVTLDNVTIPSSKEFILIGRAPECHIKLEHASISRFHALLQFSEDKLFVYDLNSSHGTFVNKKQVNQRVFLELFPLFQLKFGASTRVFILHSSDNDDIRSDANLRDNASKILQLLKKWAEDNKEDFSIVKQNPVDGLLSVKVYVGDYSATSSAETNEDAESMACKTIYDELVTGGLLNTNAHKEEIWKKWKDNQKEDLAEEYDRDFTVKRKISKISDSRESSVSLDKQRLEIQELEKEITRIESDRTPIDTSTASQRDELDEFMNSIQKQNSQDLQKTLSKLKDQGKESFNNVNNRDKDFPSTDLDSQNENIAVDDNNLDFKVENEEVLFEDVSNEPNNHDRNLAEKYGY